MASVYWYDPVRLTFDNDSGDEIELFWHDYEGNLVSYGYLAHGQTKTVYTYATHAWSASQIHADIMVKYEYFVDGHEFFVAEFEDNDRIITIQKAPNTASDFGVWTCDDSVNYISDPWPYFEVISLTDECETGDCAGNPIYALDGVTNQANAIAYCQDICDKRVSNGQACAGIYFEKKGNGHEECGLYTSGMNEGKRSRTGGL